MNTRFFFTSILITAIAIGSLANWLVFNPVHDGLCISLWRNLS